MESNTAPMSVCCGHEPPPPGAFVFSPPPSSSSPYGRELPQGDLDDFIFAVGDEALHSDR